MKQIVKMIAAFLLLVAKELSLSVLALAVIQLALVAGMELARPHVGVLMAVLTAARSGVAASDVLVAVVGGLGGWVLADGLVWLRKRLHGPQQPPEHEEAGMDMPREPDAREYYIAEALSLPE